MGIKGLSSGVNIPGYLNTCNAPSGTGYADNLGNPLYMGTTPGKIISLGPNEAQNLAAPGSGFVGDGAYQWVQLDSGATALYATEGHAAYVKLDSGPTQGAIPETAYATPTVTTQDQANTLGLLGFFAGVFLNPPTYQGQPNGPTPGNWTFIWVGAGRAQVLYGAAVHSTIGDAVFPDTTNTGAFQSSATNSTTPGVSNLIAAQIPVANTIGVAYYKDIIYRIPF
jgi:hypothetical protein